MSPPPGTDSVIAIDGPAGAGKSSIARTLAERLGFFLLDTGAIYRALALTAARSGVSLDDGAALGRIADSLPIRFDEEGRVWLGSADVSQAIRTPEISQAASSVSAHPQVRAALLQLQRRLAAGGRCVVEGRDIGTVVLPDAPLKIFLTASSEVRARRRYDELILRGAAVDLPSTLAELRARDQRDETREVAPLKAAADALVVDTSDMSFESVAAHLEAVARKQLGLPASP